METIPKNSCQKIGFIRKTHGIHGEVVLEFENIFEQSIVNAERFFLEIDGLLVPFFLGDDEIRLKSGQTALVKFRWVENEKYALRLVDKSVYLFKNEIIHKENNSLEDSFLGFQIFDENGNRTGVVIAVDNYSGNIVFTVETDDNEFLVPFNEELLLKLDEKNKIIRLHLPEGLIDL